ncbi:MAG: PKD domain-containing protein [Pyrinomonadaceae bacterium]
MPRFLSGRNVRRHFSVLLCCSLLQASLAPFRLAEARRASSRTRPQEGGPTPVPGAPEGIFPDLDVIKSLPPPAPVTPASIPSTLRSQRNPLVPRTVMHFGDPLPSPSPIPTPTILPSPSPSASALPSPSILPTPLPSVVPTPFPSPSPSDSPGLAAGAVRSTSGSDWVILDRTNDELLRYLLAWNSPSPLRQSVALDVSNSFNSGDTFFHSKAISAATFDFFLVPMPQAGTTKIVFTTNRDGRRQIYSMDSNAANLSRLTNNLSNDDHPRWSPNGTKILFQSDRDDPANGNQDIYVMNADGTAQTRLTTDAADDCNAVWSPDGTKIVFQSLRNGVYYQVYVMNADGSGQVNRSNGTTNDSQPNWSPNGSKIAFASERDHVGVPGIYVMNADGSNQSRLTFTAAPFRDEEPVWSRNGMKVAFVSTRDSVVESWQETDDDGNVLQRSAIHTNKEIYAMNADGSGQLRLTNTLENDESAYWSPDNTKIVFHSDRERDAYDPIPQLWTMNADGTNQTLIASNAVGDFSPSWGTNTTGNQSPVANAGGAYNGFVAQNLALSGANSFDSDGTITSYAWSFGDGGTASGVTPTHAYASAGTYNVVLTVTDNLGAQATANTTATITSAGSDQYVANFNQFALGRQPYANESSYWNDILRAAYPNGQTSMVLALRELGKTVFESELCSKVVYERMKKVAYS